MKKEIKGVSFLFILETQMFLPSLKSVDGVSCDMKKNQREQYGHVSVVKISKQTVGVVLHSKNSLLWFRRNM